MGGKSDGLDLLRAAGERVPPYLVVAYGEQLSDADLARLGPGPYAVRSDAHDEDAAASSQAGRFLSRLGVSASEVAAAVEAVQESYGDPQSDHAPTGRPASVIVQQMIAADVSGVAFSVHPAGILDQTVVTAGTGAGAAVSDAEVSRTWVTSTVDGGRYTYASAPDVPELLTPDQVDEVVAAALRVAESRGVPVDIEWAYEGDTLWLLQARPVTALAEGAVTTLDNANLVESYPGLVSPLTASFVPRAYEGVFRSLALRITRDPGLVASYADVLARMVVPCSGRLYYRMESWYAVLGLMPFARRYIDIWQTSLGVTERSYQLPTVSRWQRTRTAFGLAKAVLRTPAELAGLHEDVTEVACWFPDALAAARDLDALKNLYDDIEHRLLTRWDVTLLNDLRAFVLPALLRGLVRDEATVNQLVSGIASIESLAPVRALASLAAEAPADLTEVATAEAAEAYLARDTPYAARLRDYVETYGDRYLEELKLESPTFRTHPLLLVEAVAGPGRRHNSRWESRTSPDSRGRALSEGVGAGIATRNPLTRRLVAAATSAIAGREASRLDRARVYGMVRSIARRAGELLTAEGRLDQSDDVFWLTLDELFDPPADCRGLVAERRVEQEAYGRLPGFRRLTFAGEPFDVHVPLASGTPRTAASAGTLAGVGVSGGSAMGEVLVVTDPRAVGDPTGRVLVTTMTDPGWVFLISRVAAVVAERGSVLSHTAIVARELGIPAVVGIPDATSRFTDGETVTVDGTRGEVRR